ncbi:MAG TPA: 30S ribosomal protein S16 [Bacteroidia bacterium]|nr:30S ribosomal protein S16 [Bacteroidia bacterium]
MPAKIRLQRHGKKASAFFHIVVADSRAPRDGKFIAKIGTYNPNTNPATIELDNNTAFEWLQKGAQPTDTCRAILSYKGVLYRQHLHKGVLKGALTQEQADAKLAKWMEEKQAKIQSKIDRLSGEMTSAAKKKMAEETAAKESKAAKVAAKKAAAVEAPAAETPAETTETAENTENNA